MYAESELNALYESTLKPRLESMEGLRLELRGYIRKAAVAIGVPALVLWGADFIKLALPDGLEWLVTAVGFVGILGGVLWSGFNYLIPGLTARANYTGRFKREVVSEIFKIVCPSAVYSPDRGLDMAVFDEPGIFTTTGGYRSDDRVRGTIGQTPFEAAEVRRSFTTGSDKNRHTVVVFHGLFFHLDFNKALSGTTIVVPEDARGDILGSRKGLTKVDLESPDFEKVFAVHASDPVEARYILTPAMMEKILALKARTERPLYLGFTKNRAYLGVHYGRELFEAGIASSTSVEALHEMAAHFALAEDVVQELDLNTRIWTKGVDDSLLHQRPDAPATAFDELAAQGKATASDLFAAAAAATNITLGDEPIEDVPAPPSTSVRVEHGVGGSMVHYGVSFWMIVAVVLWLASIAVSIAVLPHLPALVGLPGLGETLRQSLPRVPYASDLVTHVPVAWFFGACLIGVASFFGWALRVRRVEIAPDAVRIYRGFRPFPRVYPRPTYGRVVRVEGAVFVGKTQGLNLVNPSASPSMSEPEARWVAAEIRRALAATGSGTPA